MKIRALLVLVLAFVFVATFAADTAPSPAVGFSGKPNFLAYSAKQQTWWAGDKGGVTSPAEAMNAANEAGLYKAEAYDGHVWRCDFTGFEITYSQREGKWIDTKQGKHPGPKPSATPTAKPTPATPPAETEKEAEPKKPSDVDLAFKRGKAEEVLGKVDWAAVGEEWTGGGQVFNKDQKLVLTDPTKKTTTTVVWSKEWKFKSKQ